MMMRLRRTVAPTLFPPTFTMLSTRFAVATLPRVSRLATRPVIARAYHEKVISHYERPRNVCRVSSCRISPVVI
jgi:hypothetical protein